MRFSLQASSPVRLVCLLLASASLAAANEPPYTRPAGIAEPDEPLIVAGYRALFTCSAHFFAGRPLADIERVELVDTREFELPPPEIDEARRLVRASAPGSPVRLAAYRDTMGCTLLPPHWSTADVPRLPYVEYPPPPDLADEPFPNGDRVTLPASGVREDRAELEPPIEAAFDGESYGEGTVTVSVLVIDGGELVAERYRPGFGVHSGYRTWSTAKSITAAVIGIAVGDGLLDPEAPAPIPEWGYPGDPRSRITLAHLLRMSSGLFSAGSNTNAIYFGGQDAVSAATATRLEAEPGERWQYANNDTLLALRALRHVLGDDHRYLRYPYERLLHRIGMFHTRMETDHLGNFIGSSQVYTTARDLARFGLLLANDGVWRDERILPEGWVDYMTTPAPARPRADGEWGYGAQVWLLDRMPGVPEGAYTTAGNKGQLVTVVPGGYRGGGSGGDLVIVRTGVDPNGRRWQQDRFVAAVVEAIGTDAPDATRAAAD